MSPAGAFFLILFCCLCVIIVYFALKGTQVYENENTEEISSGITVPSSHTQEIPQSAPERRENFAGGENGAFEINEINLNRQTSLPAYEDLFDVQN